MVTSYNVRGLADERKLRHLVNNIYKEDMGKNVDFIVCLQETFIATSGKLPYLWRGNLHLTPGTGSSCGCLTLTSPHLSILRAVDVDNRAHVVVLQKQGDLAATYVVANIYAPNANNSAKMDFYNSTFDTVMELSDSYDCQNILLAGDFNLIFDSKEAKNRIYTAQEKRLANFVKDQANALALTDAMDKKNLFTWRRPNSEIFSTIDRLFFSKDKLILDNVSTNWSYGYSDHAAVKALFKSKEKRPLSRSKITRLDPSLAKSQRYSTEIELGYHTMLSSMPPDWNPHLKLEFAKVCIRTVVEKVQADRKINERDEEDMVNEELELAVGKLAEGSDNLQGLIDHVEELRVRKQALIEIKGARLAERLGTKWFNEGEKSTKYFLRLLNRALPDNFEAVQGEDGTIINDPKEIEAAIVNFYRALYENGDELLENNDPNFFNEINPISDDDDAALSRPLSADELLKTLRTCDDTAPGPDGIPYSIIKLLWPSYGELLQDAWHYSLTHRCLPPSHKLSFLKLIPKPGKDLTRLTNWRPITLSNCDHKLITKTYSKRLCDSVASKIDGRQTAYLKGRLINDNIRAMLSTINLSNMEADLKSLIVSLDAKKAFDSVSHKYIETCLRKFGCHSFVPIFNTLYKDLKTDIIINGKIVQGFAVKRGVKQGDALSCILFIMCMEPLIRNIEINPTIEVVRSTLLEADLPKAYAYADDVNCIMRDSQISLQALFKEYERLTVLSGLELNAEKTELIKLGSNDPEVYNVTYKNQNHAISSVDEIKINGILFQREYEPMLKSNVDAAVKRMDMHFRNWSRRSLSTLGKILITKTFGISQVIYLMQSVALNANHYKQINSVLYKFIWNRHYLAAKAPERIKRDIVTKSISNGGFGMLDIAELDESLKIKALSRMLTSEHPFLKILCEKLNISSYLNPTSAVPRMVDPVMDKGLDLLIADRNKVWDCQSLNTDRNILASIRELELKAIVNRRGQGGIGFFRVWARGARKVKDLTLPELDLIRRHVLPYKIDKLRRAIALNIRPPDPDFYRTYYTGSRHKPLDLLTTREIRALRSNKEPIVEFKLGLSITPNESSNWGQRLRKLTSTRHKNSLLRALHGDVYTKVKLHRFGLSDTNTCSKCGGIEDLEHKIISCDYAKRIWDTSIPIIRKLNELNDPNEDRIKLITGTSKNTSLASMTLIAELIQTILYLRHDQNYLVRPKLIVIRAIKNLSVKEGNHKIRRCFIDSLADIAN